MVNDLRPFVSTCVHPWLLAAALISVPVVAGEKVAISLDTCRLVSTHVAEDSVAFQPGVGAKGKPVTPADLGGGSTIKPPEDFSIDITDLLGDRVEVPAAPGEYVPEADMGAIRVKDGKLTYNGQELPDSALLALAEACRTLP